jgi:hypothetical protein
VAQPFNDDSVEPDEMSSRDFNRDAQPPASQSPVSDRADRGEESEEEGHTTEDDDFAMSVLSDAPVMMPPLGGGLDVGGLDAAAQHVRLMAKGASSSSKSSKSSKKRKQRDGDDSGDGGSHHGGKSSKSAKTSNHLQRKRTITKTQSRLLAEGIVLENAMIMSGAPSRWVYDDGSDYSDEGNECEQESDDELDQATRYYNGGRQRRYRKNGDVRTVVSAAAESESKPAPWRTRKPYLPREHRFLPCPSA